MTSPQTGPGLLFIEPEPLLHGPSVIHSIWPRCGLKGDRPQKNLNDTTLPQEPPRLSTKNLRMPTHERRPIEEHETVDTGRRAEPVPHTGPPFFKVICLIVFEVISRSF